jgi:hypothetical protein
MPTKTKRVPSPAKEPALSAAKPQGQTKSPGSSRPPVPQPDVKVGGKPDVEADVMPQAEGPAVPAGLPQVPGSGSEPPGVKKKSGGAELASQIVGGTSELGLAHFARALEHENPHTSSQAARVIEEVVLLKPELVAPHIERLVRLLTSTNPRVVQASATTLPMLTRIAPAKVARHLERLRGGYPTASEVAKEGMVRIFVALCVASVAYQKRVIDVLESALASAEPKTLLRWTELVLPALKGEPHAQARSVVEARLPEIPRPQAEKIAEFLGIRLRPSRPA